MRKLVLATLAVALLMSTLFTARLVATPDCSDDPQVGVCCEYWSDSRPTTIGGQTVCAFLGSGCWECTNVNTGESCASAEECSPTGGGIKNWVPTT